MQPSRYEDTFFSGHQDGSARSAAVIVPLLTRYFLVNSVIDVGCGIGAWLAAFVRHGVVDYLGVDGEHVPRNLLKIRADRFCAADLTEFAPPGRRFDLACSLEVAEHLPPARAAHFVSALVDLAPVVLFSAAIPGQRGTNHVNEQWQSYWAALFRLRGYVGIDCVRPFVYDDERVELWYRQNAIVFCESSKVPAQFAPMTHDYQFDHVDPELWRARCNEAMRPRKKPLRELFKSRAK